MEGEGDEIKPKQASKRDRTLTLYVYKLVERRRNFQSARFKLSWQTSYVAEFYSFCQKFPKDTEARNSFMVATFSDSLIVVIVYFGAFLRQEFSVKSQKS